jgi:hypothetical protein
MDAARGRLLDEIFIQLRRARDLYTLEVAVGNNLSTEFCGAETQTRKAAL